MIDDSFDTWGKFNGINPYLYLQKVINYLFRVEESEGTFNQVIDGRSHIVKFWIFKSKLLNKDVFIILN